MVSLKAKISEIIDGMEAQSDEMPHFYNRKSGKIAFRVEGEYILDEDECEGDYEDDSNAIPLPSRSDIHEYSIMEDFSRSCENSQHATRLMQAIKGSGAFRRFKDAVYDLEIEEDWYRFLRRAYKDIAIEWCQENAIEYIDDVDIPDEEAIPIDKNTNLYADLENQLRELLQGESDLIANAANMAALLFNALPDVNWAGFYFLKGQELVLGPFQGKPACVRIPLGKGVCGTASRMRETLVVPDVHKFPCHIACDPESNSEIVVPLIKNGELLGVLDIDSQRFDRFNQLDQEWIEKLVEVFTLQM